MRSSGSFLCAALAVVMVAGVVSAAPPWQLAAKPGNGNPADGKVFEWFDPTGEVRAAVGPEIGDRLVARIKRDARRTESYTQAMFESLATASSELQRLNSSGALESKSRPAIGALAMMAVVDSLVEMYPELEARVSTRAHSREGSSPIEKICGCDKSGSKACGCLVVRTGWGGCQYAVSCANVWRAACSAVNFEMCVAREVIAVISPLS